MAEEKRWMGKPRWFCGCVGGVCCNQNLKSTCRLLAGSQTSSVSWICTCCCMLSGALQACTSLPKHLYCSNDAFTSLAKPQIGLLSRFSVSGFQTSLSELSVFFHHHAPFCLQSHIP